MFVVDTLFTDEKPGEGSFEFSQPLGIELRFEPRAVIPKQVFFFFLIL